MVLLHWLAHCSLTATSRLQLQAQGLPWLTAQQGRPCKNKKQQHKHGEAADEKLVCTRVTAGRAVDVHGEAGTCLCHPVGAYILNC
jgi:hypothetical protein